jgi:hypothetical protein
MLISGAAIAFSIPADGLARTLTVGSKAEYPSVNAALKMARDGDVVEVGSGEYRERIRITKSVQLKGIDNPIL